MNDVYVPDTLPKRTANMSLLLERHPIESCDTVQDLVRCLQSVVTLNNRMNLYTAYFIGRALNEALLSSKYPGMTTEKLGKAIGISRASAYKYRQLTNILEPDEVDELGEVPYTVILKLPNVLEQFGEAAVKEVKFRLKTNDFEGARGRSAFDLAVAEIADRRLRMGETLPGELMEVSGVATTEIPGEAPPELPIPADEPEVEEALDAELVEDESVSMIDSLLADRKKQVRGGVKSPDTHRKSEMRENAEIAFSQARVALTKLRGMYARLKDDADQLLDRAWQQEDYIIGDDEVNSKYRELLASVADEHTRALEGLLSQHKELQKHGECLEAVRLPEGTTPSTLLNPSC